MLQDLDRLPDENDFRDEASAMLDMQCPGTTGFDREVRIARIANCLRVMDRFNSAYIMAVATSPADIIESELGH